MHVLTNTTPADDINRLAGGKGRNLYHLAAHGIETPRWAILGIDVTRYFLDTAGLRTKIDGLLDEVRSDEEVATAATEIERLITGTEFDDTVAALVREAYGQFGSDPIAVRSSGFDEDGKKHSFAGQYRTFLGVRDHAQACRRVRQCWASAYAEGVLRYRLRHGMPLADPGLGVIMQRMVDAETSGVVFTANPVTNSTEELVISAAFGLGEGVVSGAVDPDTVVLERTTGRIRQRSIGAKAQRYGLDEDGRYTMTDVDETLRTESALTDEQVRELCEQAALIEEKCGAPQDVEWAFADGKLWILQTRPITTLTAPRPATGTGPEVLWDNSNIIESYGEVTGQLTFTFASHVYHQVYREYCQLLGIPRQQLREMEQWLPTMLGYVNGRVYYNLFNWYKIVRLLPLYAANRRVFEMTLGVQESLDTETADGIEPFTTRGLAGRFVSTRIKINFLRHYLFSSRSVRTFVDTFDTTFERFDRTDYTELPSDEIYRRFQALERDFLSRWAPMVLLEAVIITSLGLLFGLTRKWLPDVPPWFYWAVASPGEDLTSAEPAVELSKLARRAHTDERIAAVILDSPPREIREILLGQGHVDFLDEFDRYVRRFGYRSVNELKLEEPDLSQDPSSLFLMLRGALRGLAAGVTAGDTGTQGAEVARLLRAGLNPLQRLVYGIVRRKVRSSLRDREKVRFCRTKAFGLARRMFLGMGRDLARLGAIESERDVFVLRLAELRGCFEGTIAHDELPALVELRRQSQARAEDLRAPSRFRTRGPVYWADNLDRSDWLSAGSTECTGTDQVLRGLPSAPGVIDGAAVVAAAPGDVNDCVLVTYRTDPGWIGVLPSIRALVIERGSPLTHVAIVARELGIPTIVQIPGVTEKIRTGARLRVNGGTGELTVLRANPDNV